MPWLLLANLQPTAWDRWLNPIEVRGLSNAAACGTCHLEQHEQWAASGHRRAWTDPLYQAGFIAENRLWCANCHAPLPEMREEVAANLAWYARQDPRTLAFGPPPTRRPEPLAADGVTCVVCHRPNGGPILAPGPIDGALHPVVESPELTDGTVCKGCHEFPMPRWQQGTLLFSETMMQSTWSEWTTWKAQGGSQSCVDCHFEGGRHDARGVHDRTWLSASVDIEVTREGKRVLFTVRSVGVGHALPSGDLFRRLTLDIARGESWETIALFARQFAIRETDEGPFKVLTEDSALQPGEPQMVSAELSPGTRWRLRWHDGAEHDERRGLVDPESIVFDVAQGSL